MVGPDDVVEEERVRREGPAYPPGTPLRRVLTDRTLAGLTEPGDAALWLVEVLAAEGDPSGVVVGVHSRRSGLLLGPRRRDRLAALSADARLLVVHLRYADQSQPVNNVFRQIFGAIRR